MDPPPPYSPTPEVHSAIEQPQPLVVRWHPKITPFRLFVLLTTVILGTMKAIFTYEGESSISTTVEWITGVIVTLTIFILGVWESDENYPKHLEWFFASDCTEMIWTGTRIFSLPRPAYRSDESRTALSIPTSIFSPVPITGYRILVSAVVIVLGSIKATLAYLGHNTTANTVDWTLGVFATSLLYYIGLYEPNSVNLAPNFFSRNYSSPVFRIVRDVAIIFALTLAMYICVLWDRFSLDAVKYASGALSTTVTFGPSSFVLLHSLDIYILSAAFLCLALSVSCSVAVLALAVWAAQQELPQVLQDILRHRLVAVYYNRIAESMSHALSVLNAFFHRGRRSGLLLLRIIIHLFGIMVLTSLILVLTGVVMILAEETTIEKGLSAKLIGNILMQGSIVAYGAVFVVLLYHLLRSLIAPFLVSAGVLTV